MSDAPASDANTFRLLAAVAKHDRRIAAVHKTVRRELWVAPMPGRSLPDLDAFERVVACDVSSTGMAFLSAHFIRSEIIALRFGPPLGRLVLAAKVIYQSRVTDSGPESIKVGCEFLRRI